MYNNYRLFYSEVSNMEIYLDKCPDESHIGRAGRRVQYDFLIWARVQIYFHIGHFTVK